MTQIDLKTAVIISLAMALTLNVCQFTHDALAAKPATRITPARVSTKPLAKAVAVSPAPVPAPASDPVAEATAKLTQAGLHAEYAALYLAVQTHTGAPWQLLAAVHKVETNQAGSTSRRSSAGATGPMQFMPATFRTYAVDGDGNGTRDITDLDDAMYSAGRYLAAGGADRGRIRNALYSYNHSWSYVDRVEAIAHRLGL